MRVQAKVVWPSVMCLKSRSRCGLELERAQREQLQSMKAGAPRHELQAAASEGEGHLY